MSVSSCGDAFEQTASWWINTMQACHTCISEKKSKRAAFHRFAHPNCMVFWWNTDEWSLFHIFFSEHSVCHPLSKYCWRITAYSLHYGWLVLRENNSESCISAYAWKSSTCWNASVYPSTRLQYSTPAIDWGMDCSRYRLRSAPPMGLSKLHPMAQSTVCYNRRTAQRRDISCY